MFSRWAFFPEDKRTSDPSVGQWNSGCSCGVTPLQASVVTVTSQGCKDGCQSDHSLASIWKTQGPPETHKKPMSVGMWWDRLPSSGSSPYGTSDRQQQWEEAHERCCLPWAEGPWLLLRVAQELWHRLSIHRKRWKVSIRRISPVINHTHSTARGKRSACPLAAIYQTEPPTGW